MKQLGTISGLPRCSPSIYGERISAEPRADSDDRAYWQCADCGNHPPENLYLILERRAEAHWEYSSEARSIGNTLAIGASWTLRIPRPSPAP